MNFDNTCHVLSKVFGIDQLLYKPKATIYNFSFFFIYRTYFYHMHQSELPNDVNFACTTHKSFYKNLKVINIIPYLKPLNNFIQISIVSQIKNISFIAWKYYRSDLGLILMEFY